MNLQSYIGKLVKLTLTNNKILIGKVIDFDDKVDNFDGYNSIEIDTGRIKSSPDSCVKCYTMF
uniref:hypothetical protein n=1 Tax=Staphylococcus aureus TaxID=1280 RepID=UPI000CD0770A